MLQVAPNIFVSRETGLVDGEAEFLCVNLDLSPNISQSVYPISFFFAHNPARKACRFPAEMLEENGMRLNDRYVFEYNTKRIESQSAPKSRPNLWTPGKPVAPHEMRIIHK